MDSNGRRHDRRLARLFSGRQCSRPDRRRSGRAGSAAARADHIYGARLSLRRTVCHRVQTAFQRRGLSRHLPEGADSGSRRRGERHRHAARRGRRPAQRGADLLSVQRSTVAHVGLDDGR